MTVNTADLAGFDFGGYATRYNVPCSDGRTIQPEAFKHADGRKIPLVWRHFHDDPNNVLGHVVLEHRDDGVYARGKFNSTESGRIAATLVKARDIDNLSIYANKLVEKSKIVHSGEIREVSLVLSGANPGALIDNLNLLHGDGSEDPIEDEAIIYTEDAIVHNEEPTTEEEEVVEHEDGEETVGDVFESLSEKQKNVVYALISEAIDAGKADLAQSDLNEGDQDMKKNLFENVDEEAPVLSHEDMGKFTADVFKSAQRQGSLREAVLQHAGTYGIDNIGYLFPDNKLLRKEPDLVSREMAWVSGLLGGISKTPFSRIKSMYADITADEARAKGYTTGDQKMEEVFGILKRTTDPQTVYKKQRLDRDDILDITDFNVVSWLKKEMRVMLNEEIGRAVLVGDGRTFGVDDDAIDPTKVRPIYGDNAVYVHYETLASTVTAYDDIIDDIIGVRAEYKGSGNPTMFTTEAHLTGMLLLKDTTGRRIYRSVSELASELRVSKIVPVEVLEGVTRVDTSTRDLIAIIVNPRDYTIGADKGGQISMFDDFDIDYNQYKYLIETRISGALTRPKSALCIERLQ